MDKIGKPLPRTIVPDVVLTGLDGRSPVTVRIDTGAAERVGVHVGRKSSNEIAFDARCVSRHHAKLVCTNQGLTVIDLGSSNGTFLDGRRVAPWQSESVPVGAELNFGGAARLTRVH